MPEISKITLPSGTTYDIKDATARASMSGAIINRGESITAITDWASTNPITIAELTIEEPSDWSTSYTNYYTYNSTTHTFTAVPEGTGAPTWEANKYFKGNSRNCVANDAVFYIGHEFVFDGTAWHEFGDMSGLATVATTGSYNDLSDKPSIPTVNNATLTIQKNSTTVNTFTANASSDVTVDITVPTKVSDLDNDSGFTDNTGTVTSVTAGSGLQVGSSGTGTSISTSGTINHINSVTAQSTAALKKITFDDTGHVTGVDAPSTDTITPVSSKTVVTDMGVSAASSSSVTGELVYYSVSNETLTLSKIVKTTGDSVTAGNAKTFVTNS